MTVALSFLLGRLSSSGRGGRAAGFRDVIAKLILYISTLRVFVSGVGALKVSEISKNGCVKYVLQLLCPHN